MFVVFTVHTQSNLTEQTHVHARAAAQKWDWSPCVIAPLYLCALGDKWMTGGVSSSRRWVRGGSRLISSLTHSSHRSSSILFSFCQNSQLRIDPSLLRLIFTQPHNGVRTKRTAGRWNRLNWPQNKCFHQKLFAGLPRILISFLWSGSELFRPNSPS